MSATVAEFKIGTRSADQRKVEREYIIKGVEGDTPYDSHEDEALAAVHAYAPSTIATIPRRDNQTKVSEITESIYHATVVWSLEEKEEDRPTDECSFTFQITGQNVHITHGKETKAYYPATGETAPTTFDNAIGVRKENGKPVIDGTDIIVPQFSFGVSRKVEGADLNGTYVNTLAGLVGTTNISSYTVNGVSNAAGELLLTGASGADNADGTASLDLTFLKQPNASSITIAGISGINKKGHEVAWVYCDVRDVTESSVTFLKPKPIAVYVERVYDETDFADLDICGGASMAVLSESVTDANDNLLQVGELPAIEYIPPVIKLNDPSEEV
jgi:hypothetical protein